MAEGERMLAVLGAGKAGEALVSGVLSSGWREPGEIVATARHQERLLELAERHGIRTTLEEVTLRLVGTVLKSDPETCLASRPPEQRPRLTGDRIAAVTTHRRDPGQSLP